jgi:AbrB family looped-hinge helix DNA binding protein
MKDSLGESATVTSKGQLVVPARLRRRFGIKPGTQVRFIERGGEILFQPITKEFIRGLQGSLESETSVTGQLLRDRRAERDSDEARLARDRSR